MKRDSASVAARRPESFRNASLLSLQPSALCDVRAFTLLEMCIVLLIIAILAGASMPAFESAVNEHRLREDSHQLALMVRTAMIQTSEQHRPYVMDLSKTSMTLHPLGTAVDATASADAALFQDTSTNSDSGGALADTATPDVELDKQLDNPNKLEVPDPGKANAWIDAPEGTQWVFQPGELCPATRVRVARGDAWVEVTFASLTGNVDTEKAYLP